MWKSLGFILSFALMGASSVNTAFANEAQCILAGRVDAQERWAPKAAGIELLDEKGQKIASAGKDSLAKVRSVRVASPALLSTCNGNQALPQGDAASGKKTAVPAVSASKEALPVQAVNYPPMRVGGALVELQVQAPKERVIALTR